jgi:hypothetical protein
VTSGDHLTGGVGDLRRLVHHSIGTGNQDLCARAAEIYGECPAVASAGGRPLALHVAGADVLADTLTVPAKIRADRAWAAARLAYPQLAPPRTD